MNSWHVLSALVYMIFFLKNIASKLMHEMIDAVDEIDEDLPSPIMTYNKEI